MRCFSLIVCLIVSSSVPAMAIDFENDVLPIFQTHCVVCHGPEKQKSGFRLDLRSAAMEDGIAVTPGRADESPLIDYVTAPNDDDSRMPPEGEGLSEAEIATLRKWIESGANWPDLFAGEDERLTHWALQPLSVDKEERNPANVDENPIDGFISSKLAAKGLKRSPKASRRTLIRRLSFDLHGLPPSPETVEAFVEDSDPKAYEKLVARMLDSPHYGERFARHWLDIAHYADTHGFERDKRRDNAWRYRDYVIRSLNEDKPYDRFLQEQIAGDVLWPGDEQAIIATGFLAAGPWDFVGQVETKSPILRRSARSLDLDDMATQVMTATVAMTVNCARCHDHKLDPISQREYYQLRAVFAGVRRDDRVISEAALETYEKRKVAISGRLNEIDFEIGRLEGKGLNLADIVGGGNGLGSGKYRNGINALSADVRTRDFGKLGKVVTNRFKKSSFEFIDGVFIPDGEDGKAEIPVSSTGITITGLPKTSGDAWDAIRNGPVASQHSSELGGIDFTKNGHSLLGLHANAGITFDLVAMRAAVVGHASSLPLDVGSQAGSLRHAMRFTARLGYFGAKGGNRADAWVFVDDRKAAEFRGLTREDGTRKIEIELPVSARSLTLVATDGGDGFGMDQIGFGDPRVKLASRLQLTEDDGRRLAQLHEERLLVNDELTTLGSSPHFYGVVAEKTVPDVRTLTRGSSESPSGEPLTSAAPSLLAMLNPELGTLETSEGERRAALARWITHRDNPLVRRVIVNRLWQWHFGTGLVDTPSDFGFGGGRPSHPELLDWLAAELARQSWSLKTMHRLIVTSETYKQVSRFQNDAPGIEIDADNRLLWRKNPWRIEAESIRDSVLFVSGKLNHRRGGPGFEDFDYQDAYAPIYTYITADEPALWRRSIYRYIVRTTPNRFLTTLDCPDPANLTPQRLTTTTPLQSLALYNNDFMLRQAQYFAERIEQDAAAHAEAQVVRAFALAFGRRPSKQEARLAMDFVNKQGLSALCRSLFNSNEFVYVD